MKRYGAKASPLEQSYVQVYCDASFGSNEDQSSQLWNLNSLTDYANNIRLLSFCTAKSLRVVHSIVAGEVFLFSSAFDQAIVSRNYLQHKLGKSIRLCMYLDSKPLIDVMIRAAYTTEKRLTVEIMAVRKPINDT